MPEKAGVEKMGRKPTNVGSENDRISVQKNRIKNTVNRIGTQHIKLAKQLSSKWAVLSDGEKARIEEYLSEQLDMVLRVMRGAKTGAGFEF